MESFAFYSENKIGFNINSTNLSVEDQLFIKKQYEKYYKKICLYIQSKGMAKDQVEIIASNVFFKAIENIKKFNDRGGSFGSWLYKIASNEVVESYRLNSKNRWEEILENNSFLSELNDEKESLIYKLEKSLKKLNDKQLVIIQLRYYEKLSFKDISVFLNISESNAKVRCFRALEQLREIYNSIKE